jgi:flagellar biogenesis protein FliO
MGELILICLLVAGAVWWLWRLLQEKERKNEDSDIAI